MTNSRRYYNTLHLKRYWGQYQHRDLQAFLWLVEAPIRESSLPICGSEADAGGWLPVYLDQNGGRTARRFDCLTRTLASFSRHFSLSWIFSWSHANSSSSPRTTQLLSSSDDGNPLKSSPWARCVPLLHPSLQPIDVLHGHKFTILGTPSKPFK